MDRRYWLSSYQEHVAEDGAKIGRILAAVAAGSYPIAVSELYDKAVTEPAI